MRVLACGVALFLASGAAARPAPPQAPLAAGLRRLHAAALAEIQAARLVQQRSASPRTQRRAERIVGDGLGLDERLETLARARGLDLDDAAATEAAAAEVRALERVPVARLDAAWRRRSLRRQRRAVQELRDLEPLAKEDAELAAYLRGARRAVEGHLRGTPAGGEPPPYGEQRR